MICLSLLACFLLKGNDQQLFKLHGYAQGTDYNITYFAAEQLISQHEVDNILLQLDSSMSLYKGYSLITQFNSSDKGIMMDRHFKAVIDKSFEVYKTSQGKFDITVAPLVQLWGFGPVAITKFPDPIAIEKALKNVGMDLIRIKGKQLVKVNPRVKIDLNGIAQGYSVDVIARYLSKKGITAFMVEIGGEICVKGPKPDGTAFKVGIEGPPENSQDNPLLRKVISLNQGAITTSGNYRKYLQSKNKRVSHLIDPKTGYPLDTQMISATVYAKDAVTADGYDNVLMAMGADEAIRFVTARKDMEAYLVYRKKDGTITDTLTNGFRKFIKDKSPE